MDESISYLKPWEEYLIMGGKFRPEVSEKLYKIREKPVVGAVLPDLLFESKRSHNVMLK